MAVTSIEARCRRCGHVFFLDELREAGTGSCHRCGTTLTPESTPLLLEEARRADFAQRHLVDALRRISNLPGDVVLRPHSVLRNVLEAVGWERALRENPELLQEEVRELRGLLAAWERPAPVPPAPSRRAPSHRRANAGRRRRAKRLAAESVDA